MKLKNCHFFQYSVVFLGYVPSADSISAYPGKMDKVKNWPVPTNPKELQSFLGLASYYHQFIPRFTIIAKCLHQLDGPINNPKSNKRKKNQPMATHNKETFI